MGESRGGEGEEARLPTSDILRRLSEWLPELGYRPSRIDIKIVNEGEAIAKVYTPDGQDSDAFHFWEPEKAGELP